MRAPYCYHGGAMVASRKPRKPARSTTAKPPRETLEEKFERLRSEPFGTSIGKLTKREALYFLKRLFGSDPDGPSGEEVVRILRGGEQERTSRAKR